MNKDDWSALLVYALMLVAAIFIGIQVVQPALADLGLESAGQYAFAIITILIGAIISSIFFELGHIVGAKIGGYTILSVNIWGLKIYRSGKKWKVGFRSFEGLTGATEIAPKSESANPLPYLWGSTISFVIETIILILVFVFTEEISSQSEFVLEAYFHHGALITVAIGAMLAIYNIMPFKLDTLNDGHQLALVSNKINKEAFNELRRLNALTYAGLPYDEVKTFTTITTLTAEVNLRAIYQFEDQGKNEDALALIEALDTSDVQLDPIMRARIQAQKLWLLILLDRTSAANELWESLDAKSRKAIGDDDALETIRAYFLFSGVVIHSVHESVYAINSLPKAKKKAKHSYRLEEEKALMNQAYKAVQEANPDWEIVAPDQQ